LFAFPAQQTQVNDTNNPAVYMPTESGRVESAWYGTTRTRYTGGLLLPAFHEGVDIAAAKCAENGHAADAVFAAADGRIGYINRIAGNSSYGIYIVILHLDALGEYYTLYAHLDSVEAGLKEGSPVLRSAEIGRIGNTSTLGIPIQRSHLHFEMGTLFNSRFSEWFLKKNLKPFHGNLHGYNLGGLNPMDLFPYILDGRTFDLKQYMIDCPVAFRLIVRIKEKPDYYLRYPSLWLSSAASEAMVMDVSEGGVPLRARAATEEETALLQKNSVHVLEVFPDILGRNGCRLVVMQGDRWVLGHNAEQWLEILLYH
jgi:hypothetical protein